MRKDEADRVAHHDGLPLVLLRVVVLVEAVPDRARVVPEVYRLPVGDEERLPGNLHWRGFCAREPVLRELVEAAFADCPLVGGFGVGIGPVRCELVGIRGKGDVRAQRARFGRGDAVLTCRESDGRVVSRCNIVTLFRGQWACGGGRDSVKLVGGEEMSMCNVADVCPVKQISVVADLPVCLTALPYVKKACDTLPVSRAK